MNPKKPKEFIKPTAHETGLADSLVDDVVNFYWSAVRKALSQIDEPSVTVANLGTFKIRYKKIEVVQTKYQNFLANLEQEPEKMTYHKHTLQNLYKEKLVKLDRLKQLIHEQRDKQDEKRQKRREYVTNKNMEREGEDS